MQVSVMQEFYYRKNHQTLEQEEFVDDINHSSFSSKPYTRSINVLKGLLALNVPVTSES